MAADTMPIDLALQPARSTTISTLPPYLTVPQVPRVLYPLIPTYSYTSRQVGRLRFGLIKRYLLIQEQRTAKAKATTKAPTRNRKRNARDSETEPDQDKEAAFASKVDEENERVALQNRYTR